MPHLKTVKGIVARWAAVPRDSAEAYIRIWGANYWVYRSLKVSGYDLIL